MEDLTGRQFGHYQIVAPLGEGGMAAVYKAYQPSMERYVAIKVLPQQLAKSPEFVARFNREAKLLAKLQHPHILPVFDYGESDGYTYIVMPFVESGTLTDLLKRKRLSLGEIRRIMTQLGDALRYAHERGMVHRDIKPSNVLIDVSNNCLLTDFGLARMTEDASHLTSSGAIMGTPAYMSPEQGTGGVVDHRSDLYSLGVMLYEMVTGRVPYSAETPIAIVFKHIQDPLPPARNLNPELPESVELVLFKSLAKNPADRYQDAGEFVQAIQRAIPDEMTAFHPAGSAGSVEIPTFYNQGVPDVTAAAATRPAVPEQEREGQATLVSDAPVEPVAVSAATLVSEPILPKGKGRMAEADAVPGSSSPQPVTAKSGKPFPLLLVGGIGVLLLVVIGVLFAVLPGDKGAPPTTEPTPPVAETLPAQPATEIVIWAGWEGKMLETARSIFAAYEASHPGVKISVEQVADTETAFIQALDQGNAPDIVDLPNDRIGILSQNGYIAPLSDFGLDNAFMASTFEPVAIQGVTWQAKVWGMPYAQESIALIVNTGLVPVSELPTNPSDFAFLLKKAEDYALQNPGKYLLCVPGISAGDSYHAAPIYFGFGMPAYVDDGGKVYASGLQAIAAGNWIKQLRQFAPEISDYGTCQKLFLSGDVAIMWTGMWEVANIQSAGISYDIVPMGKPFVGIRSLIATRAAMERKNGDLVLDVLRFFASADNAVKMGLAQTGIPANSEALKSPVVMALKPVPGYTSAVAMGVPMSASPFASAQWDPMGQATAAIWNGASPSDALGTAQKAIEDAVAGMK